MVDPMKKVSVQAYIPVEVDKAIVSILTKSRVVEPSLSKSQVITALIVAGIEAIAKNNTNLEKKGKVN